VTRRYGHVKLSRKLFAASDLWSEARRFSRFEAWVDLLQLAAWADVDVAANGHVVRVSRGRFLASVRMLADRWQWPKSTVADFLNALEASDSTACESRTALGTLYRIVNYDTYQIGADSDSDSSRTATRTKIRQVLSSEAEKKLAADAREEAVSASETDDPPVVMGHLAGYVGGAVTDLATWGCVVSNTEHAKRWPAHKTLAYTDDASRETAAAWAAAGVTREVMEAKVRDMAQRASSRVVSLKYYREGVLDAWAQHQQAAVVPLAATGTDARPVRRGERQPPQRYSYDTSGNAAALRRLGVDPNAPVDYDF
jgi:hypothetical protein